MDASINASTHQHVVNIAAGQHDAIVRLREENARYQAALERISDAHSGVWGRIAFDALHPERPPLEEAA